MFSVLNNAGVPCLVTRSYLEKLARSVPGLKPGDGLSIQESYQTINLENRMSAVYLQRPALGADKFPSMLGFAVDPQYRELLRAGSWLQKTLRKQQQSDTPLFYTLWRAEQESDAAGRTHAARAFRECRRRLERAQPQLQQLLSNMADQVDPVFYKAYLADQPLLSTFEQVFVDELAKINVQARKSGFMIDARFDVRYPYVLKGIKDPITFHHDLKQAYPDLEIIKNGIVIGPVERKAPAALRRNLPYGGRALVVNRDSEEEDKEMTRQMALRTLSLDHCKQHLSSEEIESILEPVLDPPTPAQAFTFTHVLFNPSPGGISVSEKTEAHSMHFGTALQFATQYTLMLPEHFERDVLRSAQLPSWNIKGRQQLVLAFVKVAKTIKDPKKWETLTKLAMDYMETLTYRVSPDTLVEATLAKGRALRIFREETRASLTLYSSASTLQSALIRALQTAEHLQHLEREKFRMLTAQAMQEVEFQWQKAAQVHLTRHWLDYHAAHPEREQARRQTALDNASAVQKLLQSDPEELRRTLELQAIDPEYHYPTHLLHQFEAKRVQALQKDIMSKHVQIIQADSFIEQNAWTFERRALTKQSILQIRETLEELEPHEEEAVEDLRLQLLTKATFIVAEASALQMQVNEQRQTRDSLVQEVRELELNVATPDNAPLPPLEKRINALLLDALEHPPPLTIACM